MRASRSLLLGALAAARGAPVAPKSPARVYAGTLTLNVSVDSSDTDNVLPFLHFMNSGNEGGLGFGLEQDVSRSPAIDSMSDTLPEYLLNNTLPDLRDRMLPWRARARSGPRRRRRSAGRSARSSRRGSSTTRRARRRSTSARSTARTTARPPG